MGCAGKLGGSGLSMLPVLPVACSACAARHPMSRQHLVSVCWALPCSVSPLASATGCSMNHMQDSNHEVREGADWLGTRHVACSACAARQPISSQH
jgi:hypothetical protein